MSAEGLPALDEHLRHLLDSFPGAVWAADRELRATLLVGADVAALDLDADALVGTTVYDFWASADLGAEVIEAHRRALEGEPGTYRYSLWGQIRQGRVEPVRNATGEVVGVVGMSIDVSRIEAAEAATRESKALAGAVVEAALDAVVMIDASGAIIEFNPAAEQIFGRSRGDVLGDQMVDLLIPPSLRDAHRHGFQRYLSSGESTILGRRLELSGVRADGTEFPAELAIVRVPVEEPPVFAGYVRDISERVRAAEALHRSEETYRMLFARHPSPMWVYDPETLRFLEVNEAAVESYGYTRDEFLDMTIEQIRPEEDVEALREAVLEPDRARVHAGIWRHRRKDGTLLDAHIVSNALEFGGRTARLVLAQDVTEQRALEEQLRQSQKMEAIGNLAGGIAHDFNNILMVIRTCASLLLRRFHDEDLRRGLGQIDDAADRAAKLTRQLLAFSRRQVLQPEVTDLNEVVEHTLELVHRLIGEEIEVVPELSPEVEPILVDRGQLGQVLLNLAVNARDAMPDGGTLAIRTGVAFLDEKYAAEHPEVVPGSYVFVQVTDSGIGMNEAVREQVFDPFFTTKAEGTGLGLATVYGIVKQSSGHIWVYSEPGHGTTFKIHFPVALALPEIPGEPAEITSLRGEETILLAEDDLAVRNVMTEALRSYGYTVLEAADGPEAIAVARGHEAIDLVVTDIVMPGMNGRELVERLRADRPNLKALFTSGYPADTLLRRGISEARVAYIEKPYVPDDLAVKVREVLDAAAAA